jgi:hypothetical protein
VGPRTGLGDMKKRKFLPLLGLELRTLGRPVRNQSLYRLRYAGSLKLLFNYAVLTLMTSERAGGRVLSHG